MLNWTIYILMRELNCKCFAESKITDAVMKSKPMTSRIDSVVNRLVPSLTQLRRTVNQNILRLLTNFMFQLLLNSFYGGMSFYQVMKIIIDDTG